MRAAFLLCLTISSAYAIVDFTSSTLYDIYDFKGVYEVPIPKCDSSCLIFAATMGEGFVQYPNGLDPYASNLYIYDKNMGIKINSIATLAKGRDSINRKLPLTIAGKSNNISIINLNDPNDFFFDIVIYVIEKAKAQQFSCEVYDSVYSINAKITSQADIVTIMSAYPFRIQSDSTSQTNSVTARLVGFDNALDNNKDGCPYAYKTSDTPFPGITIMPNTPIISLVSENPIELSIDLQFDTFHDISVDGFFSTPGWNGCTKPSNGGIQSFRRIDDQSTDVYVLKNPDESVSVDKFNVTMDVLPNFDAKHKLTISQANSFEETVVMGTSPQQLLFEDERLMTIEFENMKDDQGFLLRYSSTGPSKSAITPQPTVGSTVRSSTATSTFQPSRTTTSTTQSIDNYCNCGIVDGWFDNIAASDTIEVIYNLNMSSTDTLDSVKQHKVDKIDVGAAFQAALTMFADGTKRASYRENAKQIVYYLTNSAPGANMNGVDDFKTGGGIIIVNDFVLEGEVADPSLKKLASDNFFFTDLSEDYLNNLQVLCEANCFCNPSQHSFNDDGISPRTQANRGCFHPVNNGIPQPKARVTCQKEGGNLVSIHDEDKEFFVSSVASVFGSKKKYWLGLENDGNKWNWDDKSTNSFADWDVNQPNTNDGKLTCAYATQTTGFSVKWTAANCAMGGIIYVCESAPCSRGNQNC